MGYMSIDNFYKKDVETLDMLNKLIICEKIHGTSARVWWCPESKSVKFFPGGVKLTDFMAYFDIPVLEEAFKNHPVVQAGHKLTIYGEAYGGKCQKMSHLYGPELKFIAFETQIDNTWLNIPEAEKIARALGFDFVWWKIIEPKGTFEEKMELLNKYRDQPSQQAIKLGIENPTAGEGIIIRPIKPLSSNKGRVVYKHKTESHRETKTQRPMTPEERKVLADAKEIAEEWVTPRRMYNIIDKMRADNIPIHGKSRADVCSRIVADVLKESDREIVVTQQAKRELGRKANSMFMKMLNTGKFNQKDEDGN